MNGIQIEYLLGIYFTVISLSYPAGKLNIEFIKLVTGLLLLVLAVMGKAFIG